MTKTISLVAGVSLLLVTIAFGQTQYSRSRSSSPTPSPTPQQKSANIKTRAQTSQQKTTPNQRSSQAPTTRQVMPAAAATQPQVTMPSVPAPDVNAYLDRLVANTNDKKFHLILNGKDLPLTPFHVWAQKKTGVDSTSTCVDMRGPDGRVYDIDFLTTGAQVTSIKLHRINGEAVRERGG